MKINNYPTPSLFNFRVGTRRLLEKRSGQDLYLLVEPECGLVLISTGCPKKKSTINNNNINNNNNDNNDYEN